MKNKLRICWQTSGRLTCVALLGSGFVIGPLAQAASVALPTGGTSGDATAGGANSVAIGNNATTHNARSVAVGPDSESYSPSGIALGDGSRSGTEADQDSSSNIAIGRGAHALEGNATAIGTNARANNPNSIAIGQDADTNASRTTVVGTGSRSYGNDAVAVGTNVRSDGLASVAIGGGYNTVNSNGTISSDRRTFATGIRAVSIGAGTEVEGVDSIAIGTNATAPANRAIAIGRGAFSNATGAAVFGNGANSAIADSVALGSNSTAQAAVGTASGTIAGTTYQYAGANPISTVSIGSAGNERTITNVAAGRVTSTSTDAVNGSQLNATNQAVEAVNTRVDGINQQVNNLNQGAVRYDSDSNSQPDQTSVTFNGNGGTTLHNVGSGDVAEGSMDAVNGGQLYDVQQQITRISRTQNNQQYFDVQSNANQARATGRNSTAAGPNSVARGTNSVAMGNGAVASSDGGVALGSGSEATRAGMNGKKEAISGTVVNSTAGAVSVGSDGGERQITHVAGGTQDTDAANIRQLRAVRAGSVGYDRAADGSVDYSSITLGNGNGPAQIHNVAPGTSGTDAVNLNQLRSFGNDVNGQFSNLRHRLQDYRDDAQAGTASAIAVASIPQVTEPGKNMIAGGAGTFMGEGGFAVGLSSLSTDGHWAVKLNGTVNTRGDGGVGGGLGYMW